MSAHLNGASLSERDHPFGLSDETTRRKPSTRALAGWSAAAAPAQLRFQPNPKGGKKQTNKRSSQREEERSRREPLEVLFFFVLVYVFSHVPFLGPPFWVSSVLDERYPRGLDETCFLCACKCARVWACVPDCAHTGDRRIKTLYIM